ncbi:MAG: hypothetical protein U0573_04285 [Phycisphaerales bacterium]|nr:hypothetical protein [Planctomycetota bacterium]
MNRVIEKTLLAAGLCVSLSLLSCGEENAAKPTPTPTPAPAPAPANTPAPSSNTAPAPAETKPAQASPPAEAKPARPTYTVRGEIVTLPGIEGSVLRLHHERISTFAGRDGKVGKDSQGRPGMKPMTMGFARGSDVSFDGLKPADKIEIVFEIDWEKAGKDDAMVITRLVKLPAETKLDFEGQPSISDPKPAAKPEPK